jgi:AraC family transcriptional regulator
LGCCAPATDCASEAAIGGEQAACAPSLQRAALAAAAEVIDGPLPAVTEIPERETLITTRWLHRQMHEPMPGLAVHAVATYYGTPSPRVWTLGKMRLAGTGRPGAVGIVPAGWDGHWDIEADSPLSYVLLSNDRLQGFAEQWFNRGRGIELVPCVGEDDPIGARILRALSRYAERPEQSANLFLEQTLDLLCMHLIRCHSSLAKPAPSVPRRGLLPWQVRRITAYMRERLDQDMRLDELAAQVKLSRFHFCTAFRLATGRTPHEWLTSLRIERARELLADRQMRITDIALDVGYRTPSAFAASFRKVAGVTPTEFRRGL